VALSPEEIRAMIDALVADVGIPVRPLSEQRARPIAERAHRLDWMTAVASSSRKGPSK